MYRTGKQYIAAAAQYVFMLLPAAYGCQLTNIGHLGKKICICVYTKGVIRQ